MSLSPVLRPAKSDRPSIHHPVRVLGIDLGTTNSTVADIHYDPDHPDAVSCRCLPLEQPTEERSHWNPIVPSCLALHDGREWIGQGAKHLMEQDEQRRLIYLTNLFHSCKNDMGLQKTYAGAPEGYRYARDISSRILGFLYQGAHQQNQTPAHTTCVTVPASFQLAQRNDTRKAAQNARIPLSDRELLDEPVAAFISYLHNHPEVALTQPGEERTLLVFDFGGGTCDVGLFRLFSSLLQGMEITPLSVSRYHRLGGGDIDQAILYDVLLPQLIHSNRLDESELDFEEKKHHIEPALIGVAEQLKIQLCEKLDKQLRRDAAAELKDLRVEIRDDYSCAMPDGTTLDLCDPTLTLEQFNDLLTPFLDPDQLYVKETEYRQTLSLFTPIQDALGRLDMEPDEVDLCLLVGGSCLIPQIRDALGSFFNRAEMLMFDNADATQMAVAKGAALNALSLVVNGQPVIQPICQETIAIRTNDGAVDLVPQKAQLPWPKAEGYAEGPTLMIPKDSEEEPLNLKVEIIARDASGQRVLLAERWEIPPPVKTGERVRVESRYDLNQTLQLRLVHLERDDVPIYEKQEEHPFTHVANPQSVKLRIEKTEESLRTGEISPTLWNDTVVRLASDCAELRQYEKAISHISRVVRQSNQPDVHLLNRMALYAGQMGDVKREEKIYRAALDTHPEDSTLHFNLALLLKKEKRYKEALEEVAEAIDAEPEVAPYYVLKAQIAHLNGQQFAVSDYLDHADTHALPLEDQDSWELYWSIVAADLRGDKETAASVRKYRQRRNVKEDEPISPVDDGCLPGVYQQQT